MRDGFLKPLFVHSTTCVLFYRKTDKSPILPRAVFSDHCLWDRQVRATRLCNEGSTDTKRQHARSSHSSDRSSLSSSTDEEEELSSAETPEVCTTTHENTVLLAPSTISAAFL